MNFSRYYSGAFDPNIKEIYYYIGVATNTSAPADMYEYEIPAATWVIFENDGRFKENVQSVFRRFYMEWLPFSGYKYAELPDIEVYPICDSQCMDIPKYGLQSKRRTDRKCII